MALKGTLIWLCSLAVWSSCVAQDDSILQSCTGQTELLDNLTAIIKVAVECGDSLPWRAEQTAALLLITRNLTDKLHKHQLRECHRAEPKECPDAEVPANGGLACVTVANKRYCKPLCNHGYDFDFIRRSRLYDECSEQTRYKWNTQYVGGNKLAICNEASIQVSGAASAYFPEGRDCLATKSQQDNSIIEDFAAELRSQGVQGEHKNGCFVCG